MITFIVSAVCFITSVFLSRKYYTKPWEDTVTFILYVLSAIFLFITLAGWISGMENRSDIKSEVKQIFIAKGIPMYVDGQLYNVPVIHRLVRIKGVGSFDFFEIISLKQSDSKKRGTEYDNTKSDTKAIERVQGYTLSNVQEGKGPDRRVD